MPRKEILDFFDGLITTVATVVVAFFTFRLARVTDRQAQLTRQLAESTEIAAKAAQETAAITRELFVLLFVGRVIYEDVFGGEHETRACRRYDPVVSRLVEYGGPDFNFRI
ncbi:MAG TPA: hypothetical protein VND87_14655 [Stellaceae bacterium]|nr:hypothetical protein [Stellaceae bacterium]